MAEVRRVPHSLVVEVDGEPREVPCDPSFAHFMGPWWVWVGVEA